MWFTIIIIIITAVAALWDWLPEITIVLEFCTALVGFVITVPLLVRRVRRWRRQDTLR
jgi:hypothetical protein